MLLFIIVYRLHRVSLSCHSLRRMTARQSLLGLFQCQSLTWDVNLKGLFTFFAFIYLQAAAEPADLLSFLAEGLNLSISETWFLAPGFLLWTWHAVFFFHAFKKKSSRAVSRLYNIVGKGRHPLVWLPILFCMCELVCASLCSVVCACGLQRMPGVEAWPRAHSHAGPWCEAEAGR